MIHYLLYVWLLPMEHDCISMQPYRLQWQNDCGDIRVTKQVLVSFSIGNDAILLRKGPITRAMSKRLQEDWARAVEEGPRVLMNLRVDF